METLTSKTCTGCGETKPLSEFSKHKQCRGGVNSRCRGCERARQVGRKRDPEKTRTYHRAYYEANREVLLEARRQYRQDMRGTPEWQAQRRRERVRRKRLVKGAVQEPYLRNDIFERDGWICGICDEPIDPTLTVPDPGAATIDHVVALAVGGDDTPANMQAAHFECNSRKQHRDPVHLVGYKGG